MWFYANRYGEVNRGGVCEFKLLILHSGKGGEMI